MNYFKASTNLYFFSMCLGIFALISGCNPLRFSYQGDRGHVFYPNIDSTRPKPVVPKRAKDIPGTFSIEPRKIENGEVSFADNIPDFDPNTGGFNSRNPNLVAGVRYDIKFTPKDTARYPEKTFTTSFLVQGLAYRSGIYRIDSAKVLTPTYNGEGKSPLPTQIGATQYNFVLRNLGNKDTVYQRGSNRDAPANAVVKERDAQLDLRNLKAVIVPLGLTGKPLRLSIEYRFMDRGLPIAARQTIEVYYFPNRASIPADLLRRARGLSEISNRRLEEMFAERPPLIIIVDVG
jgi:hypothetical protein